MCDSTFTGNEHSVCTQVSTIIDKNICIIDYCKGIISSLMAISYVSAYWTNKKQEFNEVSNDDKFQI